MLKHSRLWAAEHKVGGQSPLPGHYGWVLGQALNPTNGRVVTKTASSIRPVPSLLEQMIPKDKSDKAQKEKKNLRNCED